MTERGRASLLVLVLALALVQAPAPADAQAVWGRSSTYVRGFVRPAGGDLATYVPFYELVDIHARRLGVEGLSLSSSFWGLVDLVDIQDRYRASGDVTTLYLAYRAPHEGRLRFLRGLELVAGRQLVALGPAVLEQVDGGKIHYHHASGLEIGLFGGAPTGVHVASQPWPSDDDRFNYGYSWLIGGRLGYLDLGHLSAGFSVLHRRFRARIADNDMGVDLRYSPHTMVDLTGSTTLSIEALRPKEARGGVALRPLPKLSVDLTYHYSSPDLYIPRTSIFAVFSEEAFHEAAASVRYAATRTLTLDADYGRRLYGHRGGAVVTDGSSGANRYGVRASYRCAQDPALRATAEIERVEAPENAVTRVRVATAIPVRLLRRTASVIVDVDFFVLDAELRGSTFSFTGGGYFELPLRSDLRLMLGGSATTSPLLTRAGSFLARLTWNFEAPAVNTAVQVQRGRMQ